MMKQIVFITRVVVLLLNQSTTEPFLDEFIFYFDCRFSSFLKYNYNELYLSALQERNPMKKRFTVNLASLFVNSRIEN